MEESERGASAIAGLEPIALLEPNLEGCGSLAEAFRLRRTVREFSDEALPPQTLSDLLWAACGINRRNGPFGVAGRTAASASNSQEVDVFVALPEGTYLYDPALHRLVPVAAGDYRRLALAARQGAGGSHAPVRLIYVADLGKLEHTAASRSRACTTRRCKKSYYYFDTGLIAGNVYLFAASRGLASRPRSPAGRTVEIGAILGHKGPSCSEVSLKVRKALVDNIPRINLDPARMSRSPPSWTAEAAEVAEAGGDTGETGGGANGNRVASTE